MSNAWRAAGITYVQYSNICAKVLRQALKSDLRSEAAKRANSHVKFTPWSNGKPAPKQAAAQ